MVADIRLLQGKIVEDPDLKPKNVSRLIHELALEILSGGESSEESQGASSASEIPASRPGSLS